MRFFSRLVEKYRASIFYKILFWLIVLIIFVLVMDNFVMPAYVRLGKEVELPDVVEMSAENAKKTLEKIKKIEIETISIQILFMIRIMM